MYIVYDSGVLCSDHFKHAGADFSTHVAMLLNALVVHGCTPANLVIPLYHYNDERLS